MFPTSMPASHTREPFLRPEAVGKYVFRVYLVVKIPALPLIKTIAMARVVKLANTKIPTLSSAHASLLLGINPPCQAKKSCRNLRKKSTNVLVLAAMDFLIYTLKDNLTFSEHEKSGIDQTKAAFLLLYVAQDSILMTQEFIRHGEGV